MKVGLMKVWNEIELIEDTLEHFSEITDHMIVDVSQHHVLGR